jgi:3-oxoacyl-[acyl-carrier protein] reductase
MYANQRNGTLEMTALKRYGQVDDIAAIVAFVVSDEAAYITGANLTVDGGTNA